MTTAKQKHRLHCRRRAGNCDGSCWDCPLGNSDETEGVDDASEPVSEIPFLTLAATSAPKYTGGVVNLEGELMDETYEEWMPACEHDTVTAELGSRVVISCECGSKAEHAYKDMPPLLLLAFVAMSGEEPYAVLERAENG